jgi:hypothetical protein
MRIAVFCFVLMSFTFSCNNDEKEQDKLYEEVMGLHDEVMPLMSPIKKLVKNLKLQTNEMLLDSTRLDSVKLDLLKKTAEQASKANESMMDWMYQFKQIEEGTPHGEVIQYLLEQKQKISKVKSDMLEAKKEAEKYVVTED